MIRKNIKTILFASLIAAIILPFSTMDIADAKEDGIKQKDIDDRFAQISDVYSDTYLAEVKDKISKIGETKTTKTKDNGLTVSETTNITKLRDNQYKIKTTVIVNDKVGNEQTSIVDYFVTENQDGSLYVHVPDAKPSDRSTTKSHNGLEFNIKSEQTSPIRTADATSGTKKFTMINEETINNNFVDGTDTFTQNCGMLGATAASMYGAADANYIGQYWRSVSSNVVNAWIYKDWCIIPYTYEGVEFEMGGSSYSDDSWKTSPTYPGWGPDAGLQFPWDDLHWKAHVYYD